MTVERLEIWTEVGEPEDSARSRCRLGAGAGAGYRVTHTTSLHAIETERSFKSLAHY